MAKKTTPKKPAPNNRPARPDASQSALAGVERIIGGKLSDVAIVLWELISLWRYTDEPIVVKDSADEKALRMLINRLEYRVSELMGPKYPAMAAEARERVRAAKGLM